MADYQSDVEKNGSTSTPGTPALGPSESGGIINACFIQVMKKAFRFSGRARRREFWYFTLFYAIGYAITRGCDALFQLSFLSILYWLFMFMPNLAVSVRRLHDVGRSGALAFVNLAASVVMKMTGSEAFISHYPSASTVTLVAIAAVLVTALLLFIFALKDSQTGSNRYGPNPKGP